MSELSQIKILLHAYRNLLTAQYYDEDSENYQNEVFRDLGVVIDQNLKDLEGFKLMPIVPTEEIIKAGQLNSDRSIAVLYEAMLKVMGDE
jgi:hypothetical protein